MYNFLLNQSIYCPNNLYTCTIKVKTCMNKKIMKKSATLVSKTKQNKKNKTKKITTKIFTPPPKKNKTNYKPVIREVQDEQLG